MTRAYERILSGKGLRGIKNNKDFYIVDFSRLFDGDFFKYIDQNYSSEDTFFFDDENFSE